MNKSKSNIPLYITLTLIAVFFLLEYFSLRPFYKNGSPSYEVKDSIPKEYLSLIKEVDTSKLKFLLSYFSSNRFPISLLDYDTKYTIIIHKLAENVSEPLYKDVIVLRGNTKPVSSGTYGVVNENMFEFKYNLDDSVKYELPIRLNLSADSLRVLRQTDSLYAWYLLLGHIYLNFDKANRLYLYIAQNTDFPFGYKAPAFIYLIREQGCLYFILLSVNSKNEMLDSRLALHLFGF